MEFVNLNRMFAPLIKDTEATLEWGISTGRKYGGWLSWDELLQRKRVVLLAEALSGKTQELLFQTRRLKSQGMQAYFVRIEELADSGFEASLDEADTVSFETWKLANEPAWFFLDSVDEARLNRKNFDSALRRFSKELGRENLGRAHVLVTCRASDWHGKGDRELIRDRLPHVVLPNLSASLDPDEDLLAPIFKPTENTRRQPLPRPTEVPVDLLVVQLVPLAFEQKRTFAQAAGVNDVDEFLREADRRGLLRMTERPGDLIDLVGYWKAHSAFGTLQAMTEEGIRRKLTEEDAHRTDADQITPQQAREGAERLAAALVLGRTFTLRAIGQEAETELSHGVIEPLKVLQDWTPAQVGTLLRRGLFAPATYGRVRFHQRSSQEYLAASWLQRLLDANCPLEEVKQLLLVELYGVETIRPALRAVAAWLALSNSLILNEVIRREPVCLIAHGDPKSLPISVRARLLSTYATLDAKGELNAEMIDYRAAWMFADPELADSIRDAWIKNERDDFRLQLLRIIEEGPIPGCTELVRRVALDDDENQYSRVVAARALRACSDDVGLELLARKVRSAPDRLNARVAPEFGAVLYPNHLTAADLLELIARSQPAHRFQSEGFGHSLAELFRASTDMASARQLAFGLAELCLEQGGGEDVDGMSETEEYAELGSGLAEIAQLILTNPLQADIEPGLVRLLLALERVADHNNLDAYESVAKQVAENAMLNRELMWANTRIGGKRKPRENPPIYFWQIGPFTGAQLWRVGENDLDWLIEDAKELAYESERRVAFSAVYHVLLKAGRLPAERFRLEEIAAGEPRLRQDLEFFETPSPVDRSVARVEKSKFERKRQEDGAKQSWRDFREELRKHPELLDSPANLVSWQAGIYRLHHLTNWIKAKTGDDSPSSSRAWRELIPVFGEVVAQHYKNGMCAVWRQIKAERPVYHGSGSFTTKHISILALHGLAIESAENSDWAKNLSTDEVRLAVKHSCYAGDGSTSWFQHLVSARMSDAVNVIQRSVDFEYSSEGVRSDLLANGSNAATAVRSVVASRVFRLLSKGEPVDDRTLEMALQVLTASRTEISATALQQLVETRLESHLQTPDDNRALKYYELYLLLAPDAAALRLSGLMGHQNGESETAWRNRSQKWLGHLFGRSFRDASSALGKMSVPSLLALAKLLYGNLLPRVDRSAGGSGTRTVRDTVEDAQRHVLNTLLSRPGTEAFKALLELAAEPTFSGNSLRIVELAHGKAETDGDLIPWTESEVLAFERAGTGPTKTGNDLLRVVAAVLSDIATSFDESDASSRSVLELAQDEHQVQTWLTERLNERSKGRYHAHREPKVARRNEPDIVVSSTSANVEVAIEVKNGNKGWTVAQLEGTLSGQLARDYLRTDKRRHGILVVSLHTNRSWKRDGSIWDFSVLMKHLRAKASNVTSNGTGPVEVRVFALDARDRDDQKPRTARRNSEKQLGARPVSPHAPS